MYQKQCDKYWEQNMGQVSWEWRGGSGYFCRWGDTTEKAIGNCKFNDFSTENKVEAILDREVE